ncbi:MAG: YfhO family protein, partial [Erysipelotrichaceae bacterium]|nr:YfhO family protein [Erysipelotrichaceae bacterium]
MLKKGKKHLIVLLILTISAFVVLFPYIFNYKEFVFSADMQLQYRYFYEEWNRMIDQFLTNGTFPFYSLSTFLGNNFFAAKTYYLTGDVFIFLVRCFSDINKGLLAETFVLIVLSGFLMSLFLRAFGIKEEKVVITVSLLYAFSGLASMYVGQYMFHRFYTFLPLLMMGVEMYREKGKLSLFALATCLCLMQSYYFMFPTCIFLVIYYFFTNHFHENRTKVLDILLSALPLIGSFIVGFLMSAVLLIPCILYVLDNPRLGSGTLSLIYPLKVIIGYIWSYCCAPFNLYSIIPYLFEQGEGGHLTWYSIYAGIVCVPFIFSLFFSFRKDKQHKSLFVTWLILTVSALIPAVSSIFHGLSEPSFRWIFLVVFFQLIITAVLLERLESERVYLLKGLITYLALFVVSFVAGFASKIIQPSYTAHILFALCSIGVMILYFLLLNKNRKTFICIVSSVEVIVLCFIHLFILNFPYTSSPE